MGEPRVGILVAAALGHASLTSAICGQGCHVAGVQNNLSPGHSNMDQRFQHGIFIEGDDTRLRPDK